MKCEHCPNPVDYTLYSIGKATNVCRAHIYAEKAGKHPGTYIIKPRTLAAHIEDYEKNKAYGEGFIEKELAPILEGLNQYYQWRLDKGNDLANTDKEASEHVTNPPSTPLATQLRDILNELIFAPPSRKASAELDAERQLQALIANQVKEAGKEFYERFKAELNGSDATIRENYLNAARRAAKLEERE